MGRQNKEYFSIFGDKKDINDIKGHELFGSVCSTIMGRFKQIEKTGLRDIDCDFGLTLTLLPYNNSTYYVMLITEHQYLCDLFKSYNNVEYYGYWNNTDGPEDMSYAAWCARGDRWRKVLPRWVAAKDGYTIDVIKDSFDITTWEDWKTEDFKKEILSKIPIFEERCHKHGRLLWMDRYLLKKHGSSEEAFGSMSNFIDAYQIIKDDPTLCNNEVNEMRKILKPEITLDDFNRTISEIEEISGFSQKEKVNIKA